MTARKLRIAFIGARGVGGTYSGIETYYEEVGSRLAQRGHDVTAYCRTYFTPDVSSYRGIQVRRVPSIRSKHLDTFSHSLLSTAHALGQGYDVIQYHAIGSAPFALVPRLFGRKTVLSVRGLDWQRAKWGGFARSFLKFGEWASARCPTATVVVSRTLQEHYLKEHGRTPTCIPNAVVAGVRGRPERLAELGLSNRGFILFAGRLSPEKGVHTLIEAMRPFGGRMTLAIAGGSSYSNGYIEQLRSAAGGNVKFLGSVDRATMAALYSGCHAYVLPSAMEGLSVGLLEALSYGACIITTNIPENLEVVGNAALTFTPGDAAGLQNCLQTIVDMPSLAQWYRDRAAGHAHALPDWDDVARSTEAFYCHVLGVSADPDAEGPVDMRGISNARTRMVPADLSHR